MSLLNTEQMMQQYIQPMLMQRLENVQRNQQQEGGILQNPAFGQALLNLGASMSLANARGLGFGAAFGLGAQQFSNTLQQQEMMRERQADRALAALGDVYGMQVQSEQLDLQRQNIQNTIAARNAGLEAQRQAREDEAAQRQARMDYLVSQGVDPALAGAFPDVAASQTFAPPKTPTPYSDEAKLAMDLRNGLITEEQFHSALSAEESGEAAQVYGLEVLPGATPTKDDAKTVKSIVQARGQLDKLVNEYEELVKKYGWTTGVTKGGKLIKQKKSQIDLQAKNLEDLGALQEADRAILGDMLGNPVNDLNPFNAKDVALTQVQDYREYLQDRESVAMKTRGYARKVDVPDGVSQENDPLGIR